MDGMQYATDAAKAHTSMGGLLAFASLFAMGMGAINGSPLLDEHGADEPKELTPIFNAIENLEADIADLVRDKGRKIADLRRVLDGQEGTIIALQQHNASLTLAIRDLREEKFRQCDTIAEYQAAEKMRADTIALYLTPREASVLLKVSRNIAGRPDGPRGAMDTIGDALEDAGVESYSEYYDNWGHLAAPDVWSDEPND